MVKKEDEKKIFIDLSEPAERFISRFVLPYEVADFVSRNIHMKFHRGMNLFCGVIGEVLGYRVLDDNSLELRIRIKSIKSQKIKDVRGYAVVVGVVDPELIKKIMYLEKQPPSFISFA